MGRPAIRSTSALVPHWFTRQAVPIYGLKCQHVAVFLALCDHANDDGITWCAQRRLAEESGVVRSTVQKVLDRLVEVDIISVHQAGTSTKATRYKIADRLPVPLKVIPLPTRRARFVGDAWEGYDEDEEVR